MMHNIIEQMLEQMAGTFKGGSLETVAREQIEAHAWAKMGQKLQTPSHENDFIRAPRKKVRKINLLPKGQSQSRQNRR